MHQAVKQPQEFVASNEEQRIDKVLILLFRSGRTARAGQKGTTIAMFTAQETGRLRRTIKDVGVSPS